MKTKVMTEKELKVYDVWKADSGNLFIKMSDEFSLAIGRRGQHEPRDPDDLNELLWRRNYGIGGVEKVGQLRLEDDNSSSLGIKACPMCGNDIPFTYLNYMYVTISCDCGVEIPGSARICYHKDEIPEDLVDEVTPAELLVLKQKDGTELEWPEHEHYSISATVALRHAGLLEKWNRRDG